MKELYWLVDSQQVLRGNPRPFLVDAEFVLMMVVLSCRVK